ncbi:MAG: ABC transporter ATP-binding protein [Bacteroidales bacterium]|nr:ABC transporter ATP-binding protein [Bacteroidales bacterium]
MIEIEGVNKFYGKNHVLKDISFKIHKGEIVAMMGANGAGKSTLFDIIATLDDDFIGNVTIGGLDVRKDVRAIRQNLGYVPGKFSLYNDLTLTENLEFFASAYGASTDNINEISPYLWNSLKPFANKRAGTLSGGMKQKLAICCAMVHNPSVLLLDEPTVGVDPASRKDMWQELIALREKGVTILMSTHYPDEAFDTDKILLLHEGKKLAYNTPFLVKGPYRSMEDSFVAILTGEYKIK